MLSVLICPSDALPNTVATDNSGRKFGLTSYGGNGGVQSYYPGSTQPPRPRTATLDGVFFFGSNVRIADVLDGTSNTLLFGERYHRDDNYDANAGTYTKMAGWGYWSPSSGQPGIGDVTLGAVVPVNYRHPAGVAVNNSYEDLRITAMGSGHPGGCNVALADGSVRFISNTMDLAIFRSLSTRAGGEVTGDY